MAWNCEQLISQPELGLEGCAFSHHHPLTGNCVFNCGGAMVTPGGNAMPIRAEKQKTGMKKRNVANRSRRQRYSNSNGDTIEYQPNSNKPVDSINPYINEPQNWNQSHIDGIIDYMINDMYYNGHVGYRCQGLNSPHPNHVFQAIQTYPNAGGDLSPFLLSNGGIHPLAIDQIESSILNLCESGGVPDTHYSLACNLCPIETIYDGVDVRGNPILAQGCEYFNNSDYITRVKENGTWYNLGLPSIYHNMPMYPGGCPTTGFNQNQIYVTTNPPSSSGGVSSGGVSSGTTRPTRPARPTRPKKKKRKLGSRVQKRVQGFSGDWFNRY